MNDYIISLDIGSSKVCAACGKLDRMGSLQIVGVTQVACTGIKKGIVVDIDSTAEAIKQCMGQINRMVDIDAQEAYISLPVGISELIESKGVVAVSSDDREIRQSDVDRVTEAAKILSVPSDKEIVGIMPEQYIIDGFDKIKDPVGMSGLRLEVDATIVLAQSTVINNLYKSISKAGVRMKGIVYQPNALSEVLLHREEKEIGTALIDAGAETISLTVFKNGNILYTTSIPYGGDIITSDLAVCLKLPFSEAEKLKLKYGSIMADNMGNGFEIKANASYNDIVQIDYSEFAQIIEARVEELLHMIKNKLEKNDLLDQISGVTITGGGLVLIKGVLERSKKILDKPVRIGAPECVGASSPIYACSVGVIKEVGSTLLKKPADLKKRQEKVASKVWDDEYEDYDEEKSTGFISKVKEFFTDFF